MNTYRFVDVQECRVIELTEGLTKEEAQQRFEARFADLVTNEGWRASEAGKAPTIGGESIGLGIGLQYRELRWEKRSGALI